MYAIVEIAGSQFEVEPGDIIEVPLLDSLPEEKVVFDKILVAGNDEKTIIGEPYITGTVEAEILEHFRGNKILVFKKKRRKGHRKLNGHRQWYSLIGLTKFDIDGFNIEEVEIELNDEEVEEEIIDEDNDLKVEDIDEDIDSEDEESEDEDEESEDEDEESEDEDEESEDEDKEK